MLRKDKAGWSIHVCAGKGLTQADFLVMTGLPKATAAQLASQVMKTAVRQAANQIGRQLVRGLMGSLLGGGRRR